MMNSTGMVTGMWIFWIIIILGIVLLVGFLVSLGNASSRPAQESPLDTLKRRYARGEIDREEFESKRRDLES